MRNIYYLFFTSLLLLTFVSCSDDDDNIRFYIAESYNADGTPNLVSAKMLETTIGSGRDLFIKGGDGTYTVTSDNEDVAVVEVKSNDTGTYFIATKKELGSATLRVKDSKGNQASITITVERYRVQYVINKTYTHIALEDGKTLDEKIKTTIEAETAERMFPAKYAFTLTYNKPSSGELNISKDGTSIYTGTFTETKNTAYDWYIDTKYDNKEFRYLITKLELLLKEKSTGPVYVDLVEDLTDIYKNKYPEIGVKSIYAVMETLYRYNPVEI